MQRRNAKRKFPAHQGELDGKHNGGASFSQRAPDCRAGVQPAVSAEESGQEVQGEEAAEAPRWQRWSRREEEAEKSEWVLCYLKIEVSKIFCIFEKSLKYLLAYFYLWLEIFQFHFPIKSSSSQKHGLPHPGLLDCRVSDWSQWSPCRSDGGCVGSALRTRRIIRRQRPGGTPCPPTAQSKWCATNCTAPLAQEDWRNNLT